MKVFIGADHRGVKIKKEVIKVLEGLECDVIDIGAHDDKISCDYPRIGSKVAGLVAGNKNSFGILVCMTGIGQTIVANKVKGAYAALCYNPQAAVLARQHNNANVLVLGAKFLKKGDLPRIVKKFLKSEFEGGRHLRRVKQIKKVEKDN